MLPDRRILAHHVERIIVDHGDVHAPGLYRAVLMFHGETVWSCLHQHRTAAEALGCAWRAERGVLGYSPN